MADPEIVEYYDGMIPILTLFDEVEAKLTEQQSLQPPKAGGRARTIYDSITHEVDTNNEIKFYNTQGGAGAKAISPKLGKFIYHLLTHRAFSIRQAEEPVMKRAGHANLVLKHRALREIKRYIVLHHRDAALTNSPELPAWNRLLALDAEVVGVIGRYTNHLEPPQKDPSTTDEDDDAQYYQPKGRYGPPPPRVQMERGEDGIWREV